MSVERVRADFDRIALLPASDDEGTLYHDFLMERLPPRFGAALEVGCGTGAFSRRLAERCDRVDAIDLSPEMIRVARSRTVDEPIAYRVADVCEMELAPASYDVVATIATLHHLDAGAVLPRLVTALRPGGTLALLDLLAIATPVDWAWAAGATLVTRWRRLRTTGRLLPDRETAAAWRDHGRHDVYASWRQARALRDRLLPGGELTRHLLWRYSIVWRKPVG